MTPVKVNIFISHAPADKAAADRLLEWLYPMRDEVNMWHYDPPKRPEELPLSWRLLLPWYRPVDPRVLYKETLKIRRENAHIYIFLTSFKSLSTKQVEEDIVHAVSRRVDCEWEDLAPLVLPVLLSPSRWKEESRLAQFEPLAKGVPISKFTKPEEGYLMVTEQISAQVKVIQVKLNESRHYQYHPEKHGNGISPADKNSYPYLGENPEQFNFDPPIPFRPPDWLGWSVIALIFMLTAGSLRKNHPAVSSLHLKARPDKQLEIEYPRNPPMTPPPGKSEIILPPVE
ncbi:MAG: hypothetical protein Q7T20_01225 [Saprospiraceae bacterium]|nr:hypothetical protein [Saprospiraceae bacterium]